MVFFWITIIDDFDEICILIMIHKLDSKLISKIKKKKKRKRNKQQQQQQQQQQQRYLSLFVVVKYLAFIFGSHFAYSNIKIEFKLHTKIKDKKFYNTFSFNYSTFNQKKSSNF